MKSSGTIPFIDAHAHVQFPAYDADRDAVMARAREAGVRMVLVGTQYGTSVAGIELAKRYPDDARAAIGFHPSHVAEQWHHDPKEQHEAESEKFDAARFRALAADPMVVAVGECGLDYYRLTEGDAEKVKSRQREVFLEQARIAQEVDKPLMIHCRPSSVKTSEGKAFSTDDAYEDLFSIIHNSRFTIPRIIHFYVGGPAITKKLVDAGFHFTFGGVLTFARDYDESLRMIPLDRILSETDCPYVAPASHRGKRNEPAFITETVQQLALLKGVPFEKMREQVYATSRTLFRW
ncbi:MAG: TatD family hydrolase [Patescibacteria group bacterium]|nr:TatD family hydrolase [Patescibacteria group bacterium]